MKDIKESSIIDVQRASRDQSQYILDLWKGSAMWLKSIGINQWNPDHFVIEQVFDLFDRGFEVFLAKLNNEYVGTLYICWSDPVLWDELDNNESGYIHRFAVSRNYKGLGIGKQLISWAENYIRNNGKNRIRLDCMAENLRLNQYYKNNGYKHIKFLKWDNGWRINLYEKN